MLVNPILIETKKEENEEKSNIEYNDIGNITDSSTNFKWRFNLEDGFDMPDTTDLSSFIPNKKIIKKIESSIRQSYEYKEYIKTLKYEFDMSQCKFFKNLDISEEKFSLEFHHYPLTLYDIVEIVINNKLYQYGKDMQEFSKTFDIFEISNEIVEQHYLNNIGLVPLSKTIHELVHSGQIFIPLNKNYVFGNYDKFLEKYKYAISTELIDKINNAKLYTKDLEEDNSINNLDIIDIKLIKLIENDVESPKTIETKKEINQIA